jgi:subtilisin family serine protease
LGLDGSGVIIGIVDTGVDINHQEFDAHSFIGWGDFIKGNKEYYDDDDHGTHIAGILISKGSLLGILSGIKMEGIAPKAKLVVAKSVPRDHHLFGGANDSQVAQGIKSCIDKGANIILLSLGRSPDDVEIGERTLEMISKAINKGIFVVAPAGNDGQYDDGDVCISIPEVICVGSISKTGFISSFSSRGHQYPDTYDPNKKPEIVAPGEEIMSTRINGAYGQLSGTSQAATYVAGILALLLEAYPQYINKNTNTILFFKELLAKTAKKLVSEHDDLYGYGLIQAYEMYKELGKWD